MQSLLLRLGIAAFAVFFSLIPFTLNAAELTSDQVEDLNKRFSPSQAARLTLGTVLRNAQRGTELDPTYFNEKAFKEATGTLSQAQIIALFSTPVTLVAAPGAGKIVIVDELEFFHDYATAAYTGGGDVTVEYATSGLDIFVMDVALVTAAADDNWILKTGAVAPFTSSASTASHSSLTTSINKAVTITNATAVFAAGNAANVIKYRIRYHVVTLQT